MLLTPKKALGIYALDDAADLVRMRSDHEVRALGLPLAGCVKVAHLIHFYAVSQLRKGASQVPHHGLLET